MKLSLTKASVVFMVLGFMSLSHAVVEPNRTAPKGGNMNYNLDSEPESLHPIMAGDLYSSYVHSYVFDTLCTPDVNTYEYTPRIAEKWEVSKNGLEFTFFLRKDAYFHNGENVTAEDVKFSFDAIREPKHQALNMLPYIETFNKVDVLDKYTIKFTAKEKYFRNMSSLCGIILVLPKSVYGDINKSVKMQKEMVGSGPYKLETYEKSQRIVLKKFDKWYGDNTAQWKGFYNFDQITFRFSKEDTITIEKLKKGDIDYHLFRTPDGFLKAKGGSFGTKVFAEKVENKQPKRLYFIGFNLQREIFKDKNVRLAFAHLVNREELNKKFFDNMQLLATSPVYVKSNQAPDVKPIAYDPKKAQEILAKAGWKDEDKNGILEKTINGKKEELKFTWIYANKDAEKWWTIIKEDLKKAGIEVELKYQEWNSFTKAIDDRAFDMISMGWGGGDVEQDPKQIWHSSSTGKGGSNYVNYKNSEVDKMIDEARAELDSKKRSALFKKVYTIIAEDVPYVFLFNPKYEFYARSAKMKTAGKTFEYDLGYQAWWATK